MKKKRNRKDKENQKNGKPKTSPATHPADPVFPGPRPPSLFPPSDPSPFPTSSPALGSHPRDPLLRSARTPSRPARPHRTDMPGPLVSFLLPPHAAQPRPALRATLSLTAWAPVPGPSPPSSPCQACPRSPARSRDPFPLLHAAIPALFPLNQTVTPLRTLPRFRSRPNPSASPCLASAQNRTPRRRGHTAPRCATTPLPA